MAKDDLAQDFTNDCNKKCTEATIVVRDIVEKLEQGKVKIYELDELTLHKDKAAKLLPAVISRLDASSVDKLIEQRNSEVNKFKEYLSSVKLLMLHCRSFAEGTRNEQLSLVHVNMYVRILL